MTTDKAGAETAITQEAEQFTIRVEGRVAGLTRFADRDRHRVFFHTEVDGAFEGRGLATILVGAALSATKDAGLRIVPVCTLVAGYVQKHPEFNAVADPPTPDIEDWLKNAS